jgi:hypothetical protein
MTSDMDGTLEVIMVTVTYSNYGGNEYGRLSRNVSYKRTEGSVLQV